MLWVVYAVVCVFWPSLYVTGLGCAVVLVLRPSLQVFLVLFFACSVGFVQLYILEMVFRCH